MNSPLHQELSAAHNLALAHIARRAPLVQTLGCIVGGIGELCPGIRVAILLLSRDNLHFRVGVARGLHQEYLAALYGFAASSTIFRHQAEHGDEKRSAGEGEGAEFAGVQPEFHDLTSQHGLHVCATVPIRSSAGSLLGMFISYSDNPAQAKNNHENAIAGFLTLASIAIERDVSDESLQRAETSLHDSETRMALAIEGSGTGIWDRNVPTGEIQYSARWKSILGYADSEVSNRIEDSYKRVHPDDLDYVQKTIQAHFDRKTESYSVEHRIRCKDGHYKWISSRGKVVSRDKDGKPLRMIGTTTDITERKAQQLLLEQTREQLVQSDKLAAIGRLATGVAHEINSPVNFLSANLGQLVNSFIQLFVLIAEYERGDPQRSLEMQSRIARLRDEIGFDRIKADVPQLLSQSRDGMERVQAIVRSLKDFSRSETAHERQACDIHAGIENTLSVAWNELKHKANIHREFDNSLPEIECVPSQISQVILNLVINAAQSIEGTGDIWIKTGSESGYLFIEIADNGSGIAPECLPRIFEPFITTRTVGEGTGLGLFVSYGIIRDHGGRIDVKSELRRGTVFTIWLPIARAPS